MKQPLPRIIAACGLVGMMNEEGIRQTGEDAIRSITLMHERSNGKGGGFAAYGIFPNHPDHYALQLMYYSAEARDAVERLVDDNYIVALEEPIPTRPVDDITGVPMLWRYFIKPKPDKFIASGMGSEDDFMTSTVMSINCSIEDAFVMSSGKDMGAFKAVGMAGDVGRFFRLDEYEGYIWLAHARFPTNTPGWWAGAHPFNLLDWSVVHNGEISSYGINKRYLEMFGYKCMFMTDTEVMAYLLDLLIRRHGLSIRQACDAMAPPFWKDIDRMPEDQREAMRALRMVYASAMVNGPFAIIFAHRQGMVGFNDRIKLRPMVAARKDAMLYIASEEAAIREISPRLDDVWSPKAGEPVIGWVRAREEVRA